jgi:hypothetical protein
MSGNSRIGDSVYQCQPKFSFVCLSTFSINVNRRKILKISEIMLVEVKIKLAYNGFGLCVGGLLKPKTVCQHQRLLIAQIFLFALSAH